MGRYVSLNGTTVFGHMMKNNEEEHSPVGFVQYLADNTEQGQATNTDTTQLEHQTEHFNNNILLKH